MRLTRIRYEDKPDEIWLDEVRYVVDTTSYHIVSPTDGCLAKYTVEVCELKQEGEMQVKDVGGYDEERERMLREIEAVREEVKELQYRFNALRVRFELHCSERVDGRET